jgi:hypothetical protein
MSDPFSNRRCDTAWILYETGIQVHQGLQDWFMECNGKMVRWDFSLIKSRAQHGAGLLCPPGYTLSD